VTGVIEDPNFKESDVREELETNCDFIGDELILEDEAISIFLD